jgi:hypothetical protein
MVFSVSITSSPNLSAGALAFGGPGGMGVCATAGNGPAQPNIIATAKGSQIGRETFIGTSPAAHPPAPGGTAVNRRLRQHAVHTRSDDSLAINLSKPYKQRVGENTKGRKYERT